MWHESSGSIAVLPAGPSRPTRYLRLLLLAAIGIACAVALSWVAALAPDRAAQVELEWLAATNRQNALAADALATRERKAREALDVHRRTVAESRAALSDSERRVRQARDQLAELQSAGEAPRECRPFDRLPLP